MRILVALGGNALLRRGEPMTADAQRVNVRVAAEALAAIHPGNELVITHGNGPQVGLLALQSAKDPSLSRPYPFDALGAETQGLHDQLKEHVKQKIGPWKYPRWIDVVDSLPKTATGKIQRFKLREGAR